MFFGFKRNSIVHKRRRLIHKRNRFREKYKVVYLRKQGDRKGLSNLESFDCFDNVVLGLSNSTGVVRGLIRKFALDNCPIETIMLGGKYLIISKNGPRKGVNNDEFQVEAIAPVKSYYSWFF